MPYSSMVLKGRVWPMVPVFFCLLFSGLLVARTHPLFAEETDTRAVATFQLIDNFNALSFGALHGQNGWQATSGAQIAQDPQNAANRILILPANGADQGASKALGAFVENTAVGTLHFRLRRSDHLDGFAGLSAASTPTIWDNYEAQFGAQITQQIDQFIVRDGGDFNPLASGFVDNTWFCVWLVVDNRSDTYSAYVQGGSYGSPTSIGTNLNFRNGTNAALRTFYTRTDGRTLSDLYLDDIYLDATGPNLTSPNAGCGETMPPTITPTPPPPGFQMIDNFESLTTGAIGGRNGWQATSGVSVIVDPQGGTNRVLQLVDNDMDQGASKRLPTLLANTNRGTLHFRLRRDNHLDGFAGLSELNAPTIWDDYEAQFGAQITQQIDQFVVRDGGDFNPLANGFASGTWYCVWLVVDNSIDRYNAYVQGGPYTSTTLIGSGISFRNGTGGALRTFYARSDNRTLSNLYLDDIYFDPSGQNLGVPGNSCSVPIPPTDTYTPTDTPTPTHTPSNTPTFTPTNTPTPTATNTHTHTPTNTPENGTPRDIPPTDTITPTFTPTFTPTPTPTGKSCNLNRRTTADGCTDLFMPVVAYMQPTPIVIPTVTLTVTSAPQWVQLDNSVAIKGSSLTIHNGELFVGDRRPKREGGGLFATSVQGCPSTLAWRHIEIGGEEKDNFKYGVFDLAFQQTSEQASPFGVAAFYDAKSIYYTPDDGVTWIQSEPEIANPSRVINLQNQFFAGTQVSGIYQSADGGRHWSKLTAIGEPQPPKDITALQANLTDEELWIGALNKLFIFRLNTQSAEDRSMGLPNNDLIIYDIAFAPPNRAYLATSQGVYWKEGDAPWQSFNDGRLDARLLSMAIVGERIYIGTNDGAQVAIWQSPLSSPQWESAGLPLSGQIKIRDLLYDDQFCRGLLAATEQGIWFLPME